MQAFSLTKTLAALSCSLALVACGPPDEATRAKTGPIVGPFVVSDYFTPSGLMGDGQYLGRMTVDINKNCGPRKLDGTVLPRPPGALGDCYHILYRVGDVRWGGVYWVYPSNSWGMVPGRDVVGPVDLGVSPEGKPMRGYNRVRFYAAVEPFKDTRPFANDPAFDFFAGGIDGQKAKPAMPYSDKGCLIFPADPANGMPDRSVDCNAAFQAGDSGTLTSDWQQYSLPLSRFGVDSVIGGFGFSINDNSNPGEWLNIYIDDIVWE